MDYRERILELVKASPVQPTSLGKIINKDSLMASAMLSEMSSKGLLKISNLKVGSSPLYYSPDHPEHLLTYMQNLNEKDRRAAELLKEKQVLQDSSLSPLQKVCMRAVKDFAYPLEVTLGEKKELFWKWYLVSDEEASEMIKKILEPAPKPKIKESEEQEETKVKPKPKTKPKRTETQRVSGAQKSKAFLAKTKVKPKPKKIEPEPEEEQEDEQKEQEIYEKPKHIEKQEIVRPIFVDMGDPFLRKIKNFLDKNNITIHEINTIKKKAEFDLVIEIPTQIGNLFYFCKAKNNKRISNSDLSSAYVQGQFKKLPTIFLSPGILTKPAVIFMKDLKGLTLTKI